MSDPFVYVFRLVKHNDPFRIDKDRKYVSSVDTFKIPLWSQIKKTDNIELTKQLNIEIIHQFYMLKQFDFHCNIKHTPLKNAFDFDENGIKAVDMSSVQERVCESVKGKNIRNFWDILSKDQDAFEHASKTYKLDNDADVYVVLVLSNYNERIDYMGHVYCWISPTDPSSCIMIGIRSNIIMPYLRSLGLGYLNISSYILEGVR